MYISDHLEQGGAVMRPFLVILGTFAVIEFFMYCSRKTERDIERPKCPKCGSENLHTMQWIIAVSNQSKNYYVCDNCQYRSEASRFNQKTVS